VTRFGSRLLFCLGIPGLSAFFRTREVLHCSGVSVIDLDAHGIELAAGNLFVDLAETL
jgi:hypothetical protein